MEVHVSTGGCVRERACASVIECVDALTNRLSFLLSKNTSLATALPPELRSTKKLPGEVAIGPCTLSARPGSPKM